MLLSELVKTRTNGVESLARLAAFHAGTKEKVRPFRGGFVSTSRRFFPHPLDVEALERSGVGGLRSRVQVLDASVLRDVGPDHHSFKMTATGFERAPQLLQLQQRPFNHTMLEL